jgi:hypothetical protein
MAGILGLEAKDGQTYKVLLIGDSGTGKSTLILRRNVGICTFARRCAADAGTGRLLPPEIHLYHWGRLCGYKLHRCPAC